MCSPVSSVGATAHIQINLLARAGLCCASHSPRSAPFAPSDTCRSATIRSKLSFSRRICAPRSSLADRLCGVEGIEYAGSIFHARSAVGEFDTQPVAIEAGAYPQVAFGGMFQDGVNGVVHHIQENLLELVRISERDGEILPEIQVDADIVHAQVIITQG